MTGIADRPTQVDDRVQVGHWEGERIMGAGNRSAIGTLVERHTRFLMLVHVPIEQPTAQAIRDGICSAMADLPAHLRRSVTWDQGKELALHLQVTADARHGHLLLRRPLPVAARQQREHQRAAA